MPQLVAVTLAPFVAVVTFVTVRPSVISAGQVMPKLVSVEARAVPVPFVANGF